MKYLLLTVFTLASLSLNAQNGQKPCSTNAHYQFDFWIGEWEVYNTQADTVVGYNRIEKILNGCVIEENWTGSGGFKGKSFNTYNPLDSTWSQVWVDQAGNTLHFSGEYANDQLALKGKQQTVDGIVWYTLDFYRQRADQTVRQIWKMSTDQGANWSVIFDGTYKKKGSKGVVLPD